MYRNSICWLTITVTTKNVIREALAPVIREVTAPMTVGVIFMIQIVTTATAVATAGAAVATRTVNNMTIKR